MQYNLETLRIPSYDIANEGIIRADFESENIDLLKDRKPLTFLTNDVNYKKYDRNLRKLASEYKFKDYLLINADQYVQSYMTPDNLNIPEDLLVRLKDRINLTTVSTNTKWKDVFLGLLEVGTEYSKETNRMIVLLSQFSYVFTFTFLRDYPIFIIGASALSSYYGQIIKNVKNTGFFSGFGEGVSSARNSLRDYGNRFSRKLPPFKFVDPLAITLYHISLTPGIEKMELRVTSKPLEYENVIIPRISAARTLSQCLGATGYLGQRTLITSLTIHVYKLKLTEDHTVVQPTKKLVPDVEATGEYWILQDVETEYLGYIIASREKPGSIPKLDYTHLNMSAKDVKLNNMQYQ